MTLHMQVQGSLGRMELEKIFINQEADLAVGRVAARAYQEHTEGQRNGKSLKKLPIPVRDQPIIYCP